MFIEVYVPNYNELSDNTVDRIIDCIERCARHEEEYSYKIRSGDCVSACVNSDDDPENTLLLDDIISGIDFILNDEEL